MQTDTSSYPSIFKRDTLGRIRIWRMERLEASHRVLSGLRDGAQIATGWTVCEGKQGRNDVQQAAFEVKAAYAYHLKREYFEREDEVDTPRFFKPMLAKKYEVFAPGFVQPKLDGIRCIARPDGLFTREGQPILGAPHIHEGLSALFAGDPDLILDGELYNHELKDAVTLWGGIGITLLALIAGYVIAAIFTQRLERLNVSINTIMDGRLDQRVPVIGMDGAFDRLSANLNRMLDRIEALMTGMRQVSTDIAHDLRTPITRLRQHLEQAIAGDGAPVPEHVIEDALAQIDEIMTIFSALLRIGMIEAGAGRTRFEPVDLSEIMHRVLLAYQPFAEDTGKTITGAIDQCLLVHGDADLLAQMFTNLIENALIHTPPGALIVLALHKDGDTITAEVSDNGPGIPLEERENVLKRFYRLDASRSDNGAGLGLAMVAAIADLHGARLTLCDAQPGLRAKVDWQARGKG